MNDELARKDIENFNRFASELNIDAIRFNPTGRSTQ